MTIAVNVFDFKKDTITDFFRHFGTIFYFLSDLPEAEAEQQNSGPLTPAV
jgi:hypothetical protein